MRAKKAHRGGSCGHSFGSALKSTANRGLARSSVYKNLFYDAHRYRKPPPLITGPSYARQLQNLRAVSPAGHNGSDVTAQAAQNSPSWNRLPCQGQSITTAETDFARLVPTALQPPDGGTTMAQTDRTLPYPNGPPSQHRRSSNQKQPPQRP